MKHKYLLLFLVLLCAIVAAGIAILEHRLEIHTQDDVIANQLIELQNPVSVKQIFVMNGDEFDLILSDDRRIHAILDVRSTPDAKNRVLDFINHCKNPRVIMRREKDNVWTVSMYVTTLGTAGEEIEVSVAKWLKEKKLAYD